jgi:hypothetical protein
MNEATNAFTAAEAAHADVDQTNNVDAAQVLVLKSAKESAI